MEVCAWGKADIAVFGDKRKVSSLKIYHFSAEEMSCDPDVYQPISLATRSPNYVGRNAVDYLNRKIERIRE